METATFNLIAAICLCVIALAALIYILSYLANRPAPPTR
jgi:VIT1/CCC1 family predicted Fe2+/Mn2+ transporter